jgi:hypothetical protein
MSEETKQVGLLRQMRTMGWLLKTLLRVRIAQTASSLFKKDRQDKALSIIFYILLWFRAVCKGLFGLTCLGICGYAIALPFYKPLQTLLGFDLRGFAKLLFANNLSAIFKLISVVGSTLYITTHYLAKSIGSIYVLAYYK